MFGEKRCRVKRIFHWPSCFRLMGKRSFLLKGQEHEKTLPHSFYRRAVLFVHQRSGAHGSTQRDDSALRDQLIAQVDVFMHAWEKRDAGTLTATLAPDFLYVTTQV